MSTFKPSLNTTVITIQYEVTAITEDEVIQFRRDLDEIGATRVRRLDVPAADTGSAIMMMVEFIAEQAAAGLIGAAALATLNALKIKLLTFLKREPIAHGYKPTVIDKIIVRFDDLDICVYMASDKVIEQLPSLFNLIHEHITTSPLDELSISEISLPMERIGRNWRSSSTVWSREEQEFPFRYWHVASKDIFSEGLGIYDSQARRLLTSERSDEEFLHLLLDLNKPRANITFGKSLGFAQIISSIRHEKDDEYIDDIAKRVECLACILNINLSDESDMDYGKMYNLVTKLALICENLSANDSSDRIISSLLTLK